MYGLPWRRFQNLAKSDPFGDFIVVVDRNLKNDKIAVNGCCAIGLLQFLVGRMWVAIKNLSPMLKKSRQGRPSFT